MAVPDMIRECMMVTMLFLSNWNPQQVILNTRVIGRSLQLCSVADQQFVQVCKSVNQASCLASAGALRIILHLPLLPFSNDPWALSQRLPRHGLCFWQHEDRGWVFCTSTQRSRQRSFLRRFRRQPRHRRRFGWPPRKCWQICVTWATNIYGHKYIGASATCVR